MNLIALSAFNLDFAIPRAPRNLLFHCAIAHAQAAGRSSSHRSWSISHPHGTRTSREILKAPHAMTDDCFLTKCVFHESSVARAIHKMKLERADVHERSGPLGKVRLESG
jgi:hypothetical protein